LLEFLFAQLQAGSKRLCAVETLAVDDVLQTRDLIQQTQLRVNQALVLFGEQALLVHASIPCGALESNARFFNFQIIEVPDFRRLVVAKQISHVCAFAA